MNIETKIQRLKDAELNRYLDSLDNTFTGDIIDYELTTLIDNKEYCLYITDIRVIQDEIVDYTIDQIYYYDHNTDNGNEVYITRKEYENVMKKTIEKIIEKEEIKIIEEGSIWD